MLLRSSAIAIGVLLVAVVGFGSPVGAQQPALGVGSCNGERACEGLTGRVGDNSCNGEEACRNLSGVVGSNSCNSELACRDSSGSVGDSSCDTPGVTGGPTWACTGNTGEIGDSSCLAPFGCYYNRGKRWAMTLASQVRRHVRTTPVRLATIHATALTAC